MKIRTALIVLLALACAPLASVAQTAPPPQTYAGGGEGFDNSVTVYGNMNFGGDIFADREKSSSGGFGASVVFWGRGLFSAEADFNYNGKFFGTTEDLGNNKMMTFTGNAIIGPWIAVGSTQRIRPYFVVGGGMMSSTIDNFSAANWETSKTMGVFDVGGGVYYYFTPRFGIRGDIRYRTGVGASTDPADGWGLIEGWNFMRGSLGATFAF